MFELDSWGVRGEIVDHRVVVRWWVVCGESGERAEGLLTPRQYLAEYERATKAVHAAAMVEQLYDVMISTGRYSLDEIDDLCGAMLNRASYTTAPPVLAEI